MNDAGNADGKLDDIHRLIIRKDGFFTAIYALSVPLAFVSVYAAIAIFIIVPRPISSRGSSPGRNPGDSVSSARLGERVLA